MNLKALKLLYPGLNIDAVEINKQACLELEKVVGKTHTFNKSIFDFNSKLKYDFVLIKGVLIHINPDRLSNVYKKLYQLSNRYILIAEYYNPSPVSISYRGHNDRLFKRDFAGEFLNKFPNLNLVDYGFIYHRDQNFPQDDITWFLIEKL
jgi:spore coat polysaccharide biosynthesis protein SpsF